MNIANSVVKLAEKLENVSFIDNGETFQICGDIIVYGPKADVAHKTVISFNVYAPSAKNWLTDHRHVSASIRVTVNERMVFSTSSISAADLDSFRTWLGKFISTKNGAKDKLAWSLVEDIF
jgi:hypothetical protein